MKTILSITAVALLGTGAALAQEYETEDSYQSEAPAATMSVEDTFTTIDTDRDEAISETEFVAYAGDGSETQFASMAGEDGMLTLDELETFMTQSPGTSQ